MDTAPEDSQVDNHQKERIPFPDSAFMTDEQKQAVESLTRGPRKGAFGPFIPLLQAPRLLNLMEPLGAELRFHGRLDHRIRELVICAVARYTSNQFEWTVHVPLAEAAGVSLATITAVLEGRIPKEIPNDEHLALEFAQRLMSVHSIPDSLFAEAKLEFGDEAIVELSTLIGYFVTVCWIMNVARTESTDVRNAETLRPYL
jgi:4-carboxymuconolactone decarboxylase